MKKFIEVRTTENQVVHLNVDQISGIEPVPATARTEPQVKIYSGAFKWVIAEPIETFLEKLKQATS